RLLRKVQEKVTGISAEFNLPPFRAKSFRHWLDDHRAPDGAGEQGEVVLFSTCSVDWNFPSTGRAAVQVLEHNGFAVLFPQEQTCCGMPNLDGGDIESATAKAERNVATLHAHVSKGRPVVVPGPTCSYVLRHEYPTLLGEGRQDVRTVAENTWDLMEYLQKLMKDEVLDRGFEVPLGRVGYHVPCHLRAQKVGFPAQRILKKVPDTEIERVEQCSAVDGTWGMKAQFFELGRKYAETLVGDMKDAGFEVVATDCPLAGLRLAQELGVEPYHPVELLNRAYGLPEVRDHEDAKP
ncbi:MAG: heterodisulfide reductase-related iron-sulfur binding cluster, partial [Polyangiales bacterium]